MISDKTLLFETRSIGQLALYVKGKRGHMICGFEVRLMLSESVNAPSQVSPWGNL